MPDGPLPGGAAADDAVPAPPATGTGGTRQGPATRAPLVLGVGGALGAGALLALSLGGRSALLVGVALLQVALTAGYVDLVRPAARRGVLLLSLVGAAACDVVVRADGGRVRGLAPVVALVLLACLPAQLARRDGRPAVTASMTHTLTATVLVAAAACLLSPDRAGGVVQLVLAAGGVALLAARLAEHRDTGTTRRPAARPGAAPATAGVAAGVVAGVAAVVAAVAAAELARGLGQPGAGALGRTAAGVVAVGVVAVSLAADRLLRAGGALPVGSATARARLPRAAALRVGLLLPLALLGPVAVLAVRLAPQ